MSDGIGTATALINRDIYDEMTLNDQIITLNCIIVVTGNIFR